MPTEILVHNETFTGKSRSLGHRIPEILTLGGYIALLAYAIPRHEPWADEAQAWQLARSVPLWDLFAHYLRYEGTPGLWHLLLMGLSRLHVSYAGMQWVTGIIAAFGIGLLLFLSPFPRYIKLVLPFTFFLAFQYAVVARSYALAPLLLFAVAAAWRRSPLLVALLLGLLANIALHAFAISAGMAIVYLIDQRNNHERRKFILAASVLLALYCFALWTVFPKPQDLSFKPWPDQMPRTFAFWKTAWPVRSLLSLLLAVGHPFYFWWIAWAVFFMRFIGAGKSIFLVPILTFAIFAGYYAAFWHAGLIVPTAIALCWITWDSIAPRQLLSPAALTASAWIAVQIAWSIHAFSYDTRLAYSPDLEAARFLAPYVAAHEPLAVTAFDEEAFHSIGVYPYFDHPIFLNQQSPFWIWRKGANSDEKFLSAMQQRPKAVDVMLVYDRYYIQSKGNDPTKFPVYGLLRKDGYKITHRFCAWRPEGLREREEVCHVIFER